MKKISLILPLAVLLLAAVLMAGCISSPEHTEGTTTPTPTLATATPTPAQNVSDDAEPASAKILVAYFSRTGNTETIAEMIADSTGGTLFEIVPENAYPEEYSACTAQAQQEQNDNARPALATHVENMAEYDVIYIGYPIWWGTMPMLMFTFLEEYDLDGKTIVPFCTHGGSGLSRSVSDITAACPGATVLNGLAVSGSSAAGAGETVKNWIADLNL